MARVSGIEFKVEGATELAAQFGRIGKMPKKYLNRAAREGIAAPLAQAKSQAPVGKRTTTKGTLKKSIKKKMETPNKRNKGVYRIQYDPKFTEAFLKPTSGRYGGKTPNAYYPASQEYGYKGKYGHIKTKNYHWLSNIVNQHTKSSYEKVVKSLNKAIDELTNK